MRSLKRTAGCVIMAAAMVVTSLYTSPGQADAENPIIQTTYTADPAPFVVGDTMYLCTTRDELKEQKYDDWSYMNEWRCYSSKDMVNWTDLGQIAHAQTFDKVSSGQENYRAWAPQIVMRPILEDGQWKDKYFLYAPFSGTKIDVAVADNPWGPYEDATPGKFLIDGTWDGGNIDPTVYIDDHGNPDDKANYDAYLYWGNPYFRYCKLTDDMLDVDSDTDGDGIVSDEENTKDARFSNDDNKILGKVRAGLHSFQTYGDEGYASFGEPTQGKDTTGKFPAEAKGTETKRSAFEEGPWIYRHADDNPDTDDYFLVFVGGRTPGETIEYSTAPTPLGPWTYRGLLLARENGYSCLHPGVAEYQGRNYLFYLNEMLVAGDGSNRSVCVKEFSYDEDNLIVKETPDNVSAMMVQGMPSTQKGTSYFSVDPVGTLNPYELNQAETICWESNLNGPTGGFNGTGSGVKTKAVEQCTDIDEVTGKEAFWKSAALYGVAVCDIDNDDYIKVSDVDFGEQGPVKFSVKAACGEGLPPVNTTVDDKGIMISNPDAGTVGGDIELWLDYEDSDNKQQIGTVSISDTGGTNTYSDFGIDITEKVTGVHNLYFIFKGSEDSKLFNLDTWQFTAKELPATPVPPTQVPATAIPAATQTPAAVATTVPTAIVQPSATASVQTPKPVTLAKPQIKKLKASGRKLKITCKKTANASGYQIYLSNKKNGKYKLKVIIKNKTAATINKLTKNKKYFVKIRAFCVSGGKKMFSKYSAVKGIKIK